VFGCFLSHTFLRHKLSFGNILALVPKMLFELDYGHFSLSFLVFFFLQLFKFTMLSLKFLFPQNGFFVYHRLSDHVFLLESTFVLLLSQLRMGKVDQVLVKYIPISSSLFLLLLVVFLSLDGLLVHLFLKLLLVESAQFIVVNQIKAEL